MKNRKEKSKFYRELETRLKENKRLYTNKGGGRGETSLMKFTAAYLGVNPWKVLIPLSFFLTLMIRIIAGPEYLELVLRVLGGE